jgi:hypothetical protein
MCATSKRFGTLNRFAALSKNPLNERQAWLKTVETS